MAEESNTMTHAKREMALLRSGEADEMQDMIERNVFDVVNIFDGQGHSGSSAGYAISCLEKILRFEPITPLTGNDDEWNEVGEGLLQNNRCSRVFKQDGVAYDIEAVVFRDADGACFTNKHSRQNIEFPYRPSTRIVNEGEAADGDMPTLPGLSDPLEPGEPVFPLRARDPLAPYLAALWAAVGKGDTASAVVIFSDMVADPGYNYRHTPRPVDRVASASLKAQEMMAWRKANSLENFGLHTV